MDKSGNRPGTGTETKAGLFSVLGPYWGIVIILIIMALAGSAINLLIPKIIARAIDAFSAGSFKAGTVIAEFLAAATGIFVFTFLQGVLQTITAERVAKDLRKSLAEKLSRSDLLFYNKVKSVKASDKPDLRHGLGKNVCGTGFCHHNLFAFCNYWRIGTPDNDKLETCPGSPCHCTSNSHGFYYCVPESKGDFQKKQGSNRRP